MKGRNLIGLGGLKEMKRGNLEFLKRAACTIASQLPDERCDALTVLNYAREIVLNLGKSWEAPSVMSEMTRPIRLVPKAADDSGNPG